MAAISKRFGEGGANLVPQESGGVPSLATVLRDIADDLDGLQFAPITTPDAATQGSTYSQTDVQTIATLVNAIKSAINAIASGGSGYDLLTTKE